MNSLDLYRHYRHKKEVDAQVLSAWRAYDSVQKLGEGYHLDDWDFVDPDGGTRVLLYYHYQDPGDGYVSDSSSVMVPTPILLGTPAQQRDYFRAQARAQREAGVQEGLARAAAERAERRAQAAKRAEHEAQLKADPDYQALRKLQRKLDRKYPVSE